MKYYSLKRILSKKCVYNMIIGERSNGKTYALLEYAVKEFFTNGGQCAIVRRWKEDIIGRRASSIFSAINDNGVVKKYSNGQYEKIVYWAGKFYVANTDENGKNIYNTDFDTFGYTFALSENEHNKSISYPKVTTIIFDEFLTKGLYLVDEFVLFMNTISTIVRQRTNVKIFMAGNTVNKYSPYFTEMGLKHVSKQEQGTIDVYTYGNSKLRVAVEYCKSMAESKVNNFYFAFENPRLQMIKTGAWELDLFPHLPKKYNRKDILYIFFIVFDGITYQAEIIDFGNCSTGIYIHIKTTELKEKETDLVYTLDDSEKMSYNKNIMKPFNKLTKKIASLFLMNKVFYQNNDVGNSIANFMKAGK